MKLHNAAVALVFLTAFVLLSGCAHPIVISPDTESLREASTTESDKSVAYYIPREKLTAEVTTPAGGGDSVRYKPYAQLKTAFHMVLFQQYAEVHELNEAPDPAELESNGIAYVFMPKLKTDSSSSNGFTWPPEYFSVELACTAQSPQGEAVWQTTVKGEGRAGFEDYKKDFSIAGRRASLSAMQRFQKDLRDADDLH